MKKYILVVLIAAVVTVVLSKSSYSGYTKKTSSTGCSCHGSANSSITVTVAGPNELKPSATGVYTLTVSGGSGSEVCADIAVSGGTLSPNGSSLKTSGSELITNGTKSFSNGSYTYTFNYTAPSTEGSQTIYGLGLSSRSSGWNFAADKSVNVTSTATGIESAEEIPSEIILGQNYPNPFNPSTEIRFELPSSAFVVGEILDITGAEVEKLVNSNLNSGIHTLNWNAKNYASGIYFFRLQAGSTYKIIKMNLMK